MSKTAKKATKKNTKATAKKAASKKDPNQGVQTRKPAGGRAKMEEELPNKIAHQIAAGLDSIKDQARQDENFIPGSEFQAIPVKSVSFYQSVNLGDNQQYNTVHSKVAGCDKTDMVLCEDKIFLRNPTWKEKNPDKKHAIHVIGLHNVRHFYIELADFKRSQYANVFKCLSADYEEDDGEMEVSPRRRLAEEVNLDTVDTSDIIPKKNRADVEMVEEMEELSDLYDYCNRNALTYDKSLSLDELKGVVIREISA